MVLKATMQTAAARVPAAHPRARTLRDVSAAAPFIKWVGGKRQLLPTILELVPRSISGTYHEPFIGGGAVFFALFGEGRIRRAVLSDVNRDLIDVYTTVRDSPEELIAALREHRNDKAHYYRVRALAVDGLSKVERAARFIFLNRCGYNGLYRVNASGKFNVPFGRYVNPRICDAENLRAASHALQCSEFRCGDFGGAAKARGDDFVYFDPPYVPLTRTASFTSYASGGFGPAEQVRLRDLARRLKRRGVRVLLSNSSVPAVHELYADGFEKRSVHARRLVSCLPSGRGGVRELLIW
jgi:DNA adenine methylase